MKLYKCISFEKEYWPYVVLENKLRFATSLELLKGNDKEEFEHRWDSESPCFQYLAQEIQPHYNKLYENSVTLSLGMSPNEKCWNEYCPNGGVRYEFEYEPNHFVESDVYSKRVEYDDHKDFNLCHYMLSQNISSSIKRLFSSTQPRTRLNMFKLLCWLKTSNESNKVTLDHASNEIPFKKKIKYKFEHEYRFVHLMEQIGHNPLKTILKDQKVNFEEIGLKLVSIVTTDISRVKREISRCPVEVRDIYFSEFNSNF